MTIESIRLELYVKTVHESVVRQLFEAIYPDSPEMAVRVTYDERHPLHLITILALQKNEAVGQVNVFRVGDGCELANIGYHVHPKFHRQGIGSTLVERVLNQLSISTDGLVAQTDLENAASIGLARKFGFSDTPKKILAMYGQHLKFKRSSKGICLYLNRPIIPS